MYEVTNAQYVDFLNVVADSDPYDLYSEQMALSNDVDLNNAFEAIGEDIVFAGDYRGIIREGTPGSDTYRVWPDAVGKGPGGSDYSYVNKPVSCLSIWSAIRFANWMHNGMGDGDTETGSYVITRSGISRRTRDATWVIPTLDEWHKAACYDPDHGGKGVGGYWDFATASDTRPNNNLPSNDTGNSGNFPLHGFTTGDDDSPLSINSFPGARSVTRYTTGDENYPLTDDGAYTLSSSAYGTSDQVGNAEEWSESVLGRSRYHIGSSWGAAGSPTMYNRSTSGPESRSTCGFRMALVNCPEHPDEIEQEDSP